MRLSLPKSRINSWNPGNPTERHLKSSFDFRTLETSSEGPKRHNVRLCRCTLGAKCGSVHAGSGTGLGEYTLKDGPWVPGGTYQPGLRLGFKGAVLHNGIKRCLLALYSQMCHRIGEKSDINVLKTVINVRFRCDFIRVSEATFSDIYVLFWRFRRIQSHLDGLFEGNVLKVT